MSCLENLFEIEDPGLLAGVYLGGKKELLPVGPKGHIGIPEGVRPTEFHLLLAGLDKGLLIVQKKISEMGGDYKSEELSSLATLPAGFKGVVMHSPIVVKYEGKNARTAWHPGDGGTNRLDSFHIYEDGRFGLRQTGVFTHDDGKSFRLFSEWRFLGRLYRSSHFLARNGLVAVPESLRWGSFNANTSDRTQIFEEAAFQDLLKGVNLQAWNGAAEEVEPILPIAKTPNHATVDWFITFASRQGAGIVKLGNGKPAWLQAHDISPECVDSLRENGEPMFHFGDEVSYENLNFSWGSKKGPPKIEGVRMVNRRW